MRAVAIILSAGCPALLLLGRHRPDLHHAIQICSDGRPLTALHLVSSLHRLFVPISPKDVITELNRTIQFQSSCLVEDKFDSIPVSVLLDGWPQVLVQFSPDRAGPMSLSGHGERQPSKVCWPCSPGPSRWEIRVRFR